MITLLESNAMPGRTSGETITLGAYEESVLVAHGRAKYEEKEEKRVPSFNEPDKNKHERRDR